MLLGVDQLALRVGGLPPCLDQHRLELPHPLVRLVAGRLRRRLVVLERPDLLPQREGFGRGGLALLQQRLALGLELRLQVLDFGL